MTSRLSKLVFSGALIVSCAEAAPGQDLLPPPVLENSQRGLALVKLGPLSHKWSVDQDGHPIWVEHIPNASRQWFLDFEIVSWIEKPVGARAGTLGNRARAPKSRVGRADLRPR